MKTYLYTKLCVNIYSIFIHTLQNYKQPKCPSAAVSVNKQWYIHTMKYYTAKKREQTNDPCNNMDESKKHYVKW